MHQHHQRKWSRLIALLLVGTVSPSVLTYVPERAVAQIPTVAPSACTEISTPLTPEEQVYARSAWQYFVSNYQPATGLTNATAGYPSGTLWDIGNYLMALNAARWLNLTDQGDFDYRLNQFLKTLGDLKLFEDTLPNKVYNTATGEMTDYANNPIERGIGWSALDIGRLLAALHVIRTCHPQYEEWIKGILATWKIDRSVKDDQLYGALVRPDGSTMLVQEGRLGYEEYAARGYELWGFKASKALALEPYKFVDINGVKIPVDTRDYQNTQANNYVVSESYILDGIEFGLEGYLKDYAASVLDAQKRRFDATGQLTSVSEDNIDQAPYFLYNTVYANGNAWATITDENKPYPQLRSISTKAAFGWRYLYPDNAYAQQVFDAVKDLRSPDGDGFYAGLYEETKQPNKALTGNTNGLILEILYYKARGNRPLIGSSLVTFAPGQPSGNVLSATSTASQPVGGQGVAPSPTDALAQRNGTSIAVSPIPPVGKPQRSTCPSLARPLSVPERRYAEAAWQYFKANYQLNTGLVNDRSDMNGATLWGLGDYIAALNAARSLDIISAEEFDQRTRLLLGALQKLPLFAGQLPHRGYNTQSLQPVDYGSNPSTTQGSSNPTAKGTGWSALDIGRILAALYKLKTCHPEYTNAVDRIVLEWSYSQVVRDGLLFSARVTKDENGRLLTQVKPEARLGYEEYAARAFQLWGFNVDRSAVGGQYQTALVEGVQIPTGRVPNSQFPIPNSQYTVSNPFLLYGLEFGFDPQMRQLVQPILQAQAERYRRTGTFTAAATTLSDKPPYVVNSTITNQEEAWATLDDEGKSVPDARTVSTAAAFAFHALFPENNYTRELLQASTDLYNPQLGYYEGFSEKTGKPETALSGSTNSLILQSLLYVATNQQPLIRPETAMNSPWWQAVAAGNAGRGLPRSATQTARWVADASGAYWVSTRETTPVVLPVADPPNPPYQGGLRVNSPRETTPVVLPVADPPNPPYQGGLREESRNAIASPAPTVEPTPVQPATPSPSTAQQPASDVLAAATPASSSSFTEADRIAAQLAWRYFERNWNPQTGFVNAVENYPWTTLWDQGSAILGIHAARQLGVIQPERFNSMITRLLLTLESLPLPATGLPNKAYSTRTGEMRRLNNTPDPNGTSGWSALDTARFLLALHVLRTHYPEYSDRINGIVEGWELSKLVQDGWLYGGIPSSNGQLQMLQEGRLGYEQYAAYSLQLWGIEAENALYNPPVQTVEVDGISLQVDLRNLENSNATNYLTNDPYLLWGLELGWNDTVKPQVLNLLKVQAQRFERTQILTAVNEDSLDRPPYFLYYSVYANGQPWNATNSQGKAYPQLRFLSTKAAFAWAALMPDDSYAKTLREAVQTLGDRDRGYFAGRYENPRLGVNDLLNVNTNAVILESLLYQARGSRPLAF